MRRGESVLRSALFDMGILGRDTHYFWRKGEIRGVYVDRSPFDLKTSVRIENSESTGS
jgi:hypothetical protein